MTISPASRSRGRRRPPWWPDTEPWPPPSRRALRDERRARFVRHSAWYSFWPIWALFWVVANLLRRNADIPVSGGVVVLLACAAAAGAVAFIVHRISGPIADIVSAAERIKRRDYSVRVREPESGFSWMRDTAKAFNAMARELEIQDQTRRRLMADIAHELRTPLTVMQGKLEGLIDGLYPSDGDQLQALLEDTRMLARIVEDLRTLSAAESGALALAKEPTDVLALASDVAASLKTTADEAGVTLDVFAGQAGEIEPVAIDPLRIREVLLNLVTNALRYTPRGGRVRIGLRTATRALEVYVSDTGAGIPAEDLPRIFDRFYKGTGSSGSGLGLTIARSFVEAHGGSIRAESQVGRGTTIFCSLPT